MCVCVCMYVCKRIRRVREDERASLPRYEPCTLMSVFLLIFSSIKISDELTLVALKLNDVSVFRILNDASVAVEPLFAFLENDLLVDLRIDSLRERVKYTKSSRVSQSSRSAVNERRARSLSLSNVSVRFARDSAHAVAHLHSRPTLSSVALLHANVNVVVLPEIRRFFLLLFALYFVSKVERFVRKGSFAGMTFAQNARVVSHQVIINRRSRSSSSSASIARARLARTIHPRVSIHASREFDTARASNDRSFSRPSRVDASRPETRLATRRPVETTRRGIDRVCRAIFERRRARDARRDGARDSDEETPKRGRRPYMSTRSPRT